MTLSQLINVASMTMLRDELTLGRPGLPCCSWHSRSPLRAPRRISSEIPGLKKLESLGSRFGDRKCAAGSAILARQGPHNGQHSLALPSHTAVEQRSESCPAGAYLIRAWIKSEAEQAVTILVQNSDRPWLAYSCSEHKIPKNQWVQVHTFCSVDEAGPLTVTIGAMTEEFQQPWRRTELASPILLDDCELIRFTITGRPRRRYGTPVDGSGPQTGSFGRLESGGADSSAIPSLLGRPSSQDAISPRSGAERRWRTADLRVRGRDASTEGPLVIP